MGTCTIGTATYQSAAYAAGYIIGKKYGEEAKIHYEKFDPQTGEIFTLEPEFLACSRNPAIGKNWHTKFRSDIYPDDFVIVDTKKRQTPRYFDKLEKRNQATAEALHTLKKSRRKKQLTPQKLKNSKPARLAVREEIQTAKTKLYKREL